MRSIALGIVCLALVGCGGEDESVSGVFPSSAFLGRTVRVQVSGDNTNWGSGTSVDFGAGITVSAVSVASPTALFADIVVADTATLGRRDIVVRGGGDTLTLTQAFELTSPINITWRGTLAQGSIASFTINNFDFFSPFDDTCTAPSFFGCLEFGNVEVDSPPGTIAVLDGVTPYTLTGQLYIDMDAAAGPLSVLSGPAGTAQLVSPSGASVEITARTATALTGDMATATVATPYASHVYDVTTMANDVNRFSASSSVAAPAIYLLPESGRFTELISGGARPVAITQAAGRIYAVAVDSSGEQGFSYTIRNQPLALTPLAEAGNNDTAGNAQQAASAAILFTGASISTVDDQDWIRFDVPSGSNTRRVRVVTAPGDRFADIAVDIYAPNDTTRIGGADNSYHENVTSNAIGTANQVYVKFWSDPSYYDPTQKNYIAAIWLE
jgi:hypothetical protein